MAISDSNTVLTSIAYNIRLRGTLQPLYMYSFFVVLMLIHWFLMTRVYPLIIVLPTMEKTVGIERTNYGCWCVLDFFNLRPDDGVSLSVIGIIGKGRHDCFIH